MKPEIPEGWTAFNKDLEGVLYQMYVDVVGVITVAMGNALFSLEDALSLEFRLSNGMPASRQNVIAAWKTLKNDPACASKGHKYSEKLSGNQVFLTEESAQKLIAAKLAQHDKAFSKRFKNWDDVPWQAQMAVHSMGWAMGSGFPAKFPKFSKAFAAGDFESCTEVVGKWPDTKYHKDVPKYQCDISPVKVNGELVWGTIIERNLLNRQLLLEAACSPG